MNIIVDGWATDKQVHSFVFSGTEDFPLLGKSVGQGEYHTYKENEGIYKRSDERQLYNDEKYFL